MGHWIVRAMLLAPVLWAAPAALTLRVSDPSGAAVAGATAALSAGARIAAGSCRTGGDGICRWEQLPPGSYLIEVRREGFAARRVAAVVEAGREGEVAVALSLNAVREELTVSAEAGQVANADAVPARVTLIPRSTIEERSATTLAEAVDGEPGAGQLRTAPAMGAIFVRGLTGKNVAVYRDGVRFTTSAQRGGVSTFLNLNEPSALESIEIVRGPDGAQYGSDSMGGTVNLVSQAPAHGEAASFYQSVANAFGASAAGSMGGPRAGLSVALNGRRANPIRTGGALDSHAAVTRFLGLPSSVLGDRLPDTGFTQYGGTLHGTARLAHAKQLTGHYERAQQDGAKRYDQMLGGDGNLIADLRNLMLDFGYLRYAGLHTGPFQQLSLTGSFNAQREERVNQGGQGNPNGSITHQYEKTKSWGVQALGQRTAAEQQLAIGAEGYIERIAAPSFSVNPVTGVTTLARGRVPDGARYMPYGVFLADVWQPERAHWLRVSGALRYGGTSYRSRANPLRLWPDDSLSVNAFSGRIGAVVTPWEAVSFHGQYSRGFRAPNVTDLGTLGLQGNGSFEAAAVEVAGRNATVGDRADAQAQPTRTPVAKVDAETSDNVEGGVTVRTGRLRLDTTAFRLALGNSIVSQALLLPPGAVGQTLGDQVISSQLASGAVFVPAATSPVLVRANYGAARLLGVEESLRVRVTDSISLNQNYTWIEASDSRTGLPPDIEPGVPPATLNASLLWSHPARRMWVELYGTAAGRQERIPSISLADRRVGAARSRPNIASFFRNGARVRGLVVNDRLVATGETLAQVQERVLGTAQSAPMFTAIPGWLAVGVRAGFPVNRRSELLADFANLADHNYRGIGWGIDAAGRGVTLRWKWRL